MTNTNDMDNAPKTAYDLRYWDEYSLLQRCMILAIIGCMALGLLFAELSASSGSAAHASSTSHSHVMTVEICEPYSPDTKTIVTALGIAPNPKAPFMLNTHYVNASYVRRFDGSIKISYLYAADTSSVSRLSCAKK